MLHLSRESKLTELREALEKLNSEFFQAVSLRRETAIQIQKLKSSKEEFPNFDPQREIDVFRKFQKELASLTEKELLSFSLIMEDQAMSLRPDSYPTWSHFVHLSSHNSRLYEMINPMILKIVRPNLFNSLSLSSEFSFLKDF